MEFLGCCSTRNNANGSDHRHRKQTRDLQDSGRKAAFSADSSSMSPEDRRGVLTTNSRISPNRAGTASPPPGTFSSPSMSSTRSGIEIKDTITLSCFNEADEELQDVTVGRNVSWHDAAEMFSKVFGQKCMLAYDNGVGIDIAVESQKEWKQFYRMVGSLPELNGEYDVLLLPAGSWEVYKKKHEGDGGLVE